ncbi:MAG: glycosyltransferase family 2 protein [Candidatus Binatia bacterium]
MDAPSTPSRLPISVIIPAYNAADFLSDAIGSAIHQTRPPAEIIVVDDGSTDDTALIAAKFGVRLLRQPKRGPSAARNAAIRVASQEWIAFLDADDMWEPTKLEHQWSCLYSDPELGVVCTDASEFDASGLLRPSFFAKLGHYHRIERHQLAPHLVSFEATSLQFHFNHGNFLLTPTVLVRRALLIEVGLFDETLTHCEDRELWLRLLPRTRAGVVELPLMRRRLHSSSTSCDLAKMARGIAGVADRVLAAPQKYPPAAYEYYRRERSNIYLNAGRFAEEYGDIAAARSFYFRSWQYGANARSFCLTVYSCLPAVLRRQIRKALLRARGGLVASQQ